MGLLLIGHLVFQMGKKTTQEAPLCGKTSKAANHSHMGLVSNILLRDIMWLELVTEKLHGSLSSLSRLLYLVLYTMKKHTGFFENS